MSASASATVMRFGRFEADLSAAGEYENPVQDVRVDVDFVGPGGERRTVEAFWYGGKTWKVRFSPSQAGEWSYRTRSSVEKDEGLHGRAGSFTCVPGSASNPLYRRGRLQVSKDRRHLVHEDGTPFFWLADTAWNGPLKADTASFERYLDDRSAKGFNAVQFVATQWRSATGNADGRPAFYGRDKIAIDPEFYEWMDERLHAMNERGIVAAPVLIWAIGGRTAPLNPGQFLPDDQIVVLARYMVARWGAHHVVFFLAGDDDYRGEKAERWRKIGRAVFGEAAGHLVTMHPGGRMWVAEEFRREPWFSFNGYQSGHGDAPDHLRWLTEGPPAQEWAKEPALPHINLEPNYEAHIARPSAKLFDAKAVRRAAYWSALATPTAGVSYGGHGVWSWELAPRLPMTHPYTGVAAPWHEAIQLPGSIGMKHLKQVFTSLPWWTLRPDPDLVVDQPGQAAAERFIAAARSQSGDAALLYVPEGGKVTLRTDRLAAPASAFWFDPVTGSRREAGRVSSRGVQRFEADPGQDWVLVIQSESAKAAASSPGPPADWRFHGGDPGHTQYSRLAQIHKGNVHRLKQAWVYRTGDARPDGRSQIQCHPIVVGSVVYATSPGRKAFALDAATGKQLWTFDPFPAGAPERSLGVSRGVVYWEEGEDKRILFSAGQRLFALDARTGQKIAAFGSNGSIDLRDGLDRDVSGLHVLSNTPGAIYRDLLILGSSVSEGPGPSAPGHVRAYDVRSGKIRWIFHTIPHPGELGYDTWPKDAWTRSGGANAWSGISVDHARGLVFLPTGSAAFDFWGGDRHGANLFANCVLALDAATGKRVWHYQIVHHDLWDRDLPAAPVLVTVRHGGRAKDAVAQVTKSGHVFLLDRESGVPLFPVEEREVPASDLSGEAAWPTQPFPLKPPPFSRQTLTERDVTDLSPEARAHVLERLRRLKPGRPFLPPSKEGTVIFPGFDGGGEWGGAAFDPQTRLLYVNGNEMPWVLTMVEVGGESSVGKTVYEQHCASCHGIDRRGAPQQAAPPVDDLAGKWKKAQLEELLRDGKGVMPAFAFLSNDERSVLADYLLGATAPARAPAARPADVRSPYTHTGYNRFLDPEGHPAVKPPWGTLNAIDLDKGEIAWTVTLGELEELTRRGIPPTGTENYGGPIVTAGGLLFIGATKDEKFRAFDKKTGKLLWEVALPAGGYATPSTYEVGGRQFVVIAAGGGKMGTKSGDAYVAFALPDGEK